MMEFAHPWLLLLALAVPPLIWWWWRHSQRGALRYPDTGLCGALPPGRGRWARRGGAGLRAVVLVLLVVALAGPRWPDLRTRLTTQGIAIGVLLDTSGSMAERDFDWQGEPLSRLEAAKRAFRLLVAGGEGPGGEVLEGRPQDLIALVTFGTRPESTCPLTLSHSVLLRLLEGAQPQGGPTVGQTNVGDAIIWGLHRLQSAGARRKVLILLTDGEHNVAAPALKPRQAAQLAANLKVPVYVIDAAGSGKVADKPEDQAEDAPRPEEASPAESPAGRAPPPAILQAVARLTGGRYFRAPDTQGLLAVCQEIDRLERQEIESFQYRRYREGYPWFGLAGLAALAAMLVLELTVWRRLP